MIIGTISENDDDLTPEQILWRSVLKQVLVDAMSLNNSCEARFNRQKARDWIGNAFKKRNRDFVLICDLSGLHVDYVRKEFRRELRKIGIL